MENVNNLLTPDWISVSSKESFLEDLNSILNLRKILYLFENEELDSIALKMRSVEQSGYMDNRQSLLAFFQKVLFCGLALSCYHVKL